MGLLSKSTFVEACLTGIKSAQQQYCDMSGDEWLCWAPEYFITSNIAQSLHRAKGSKFITIENSAYSALECAGAVGKGRFHADIRAKGRFDILLWWAKGFPRAVIEVKNRVFNKTQYELDLKRIAKVLKRKRNESTIDFGAFVFFTAADKSSQRSVTHILQQRKSTIQANAQDIVGEDFVAKLFTTEIYIEGESGWFGGCILIDYR